MRKARRFPSAARRRRGGRRSPARSKSRSPAARLLSYLPARVLPHEGLGAAPRFPPAARSGRLRIASPRRRSARTDARPSRVRRCREAHARAREAALPLAGLGLQQRPARRGARRRCRPRLDRAPDPRTRRRQSPASSPGARRGVDPAELLAEPVGLFEVVADDLVVPGPIPSARARANEASSGVELAAQLLRKGGVGDVANQHMVEAKAVVAGEQGAVGAHELFPPQREQVTAETGRSEWDESRRRRRDEESSFDAPAGGPPLAGRQAVDARCEQRLDRRRDGVSPASGRRPASRASARQRAGCLRPWTIRRRTSGQLAARREGVDEARDVGVVEWFERDEARGRGGPGRRLEEVGPGGAVQQDRGTAREADQVLDEVEQRRLGPVDVVHDDDERPVAASARRSGGKPRRSLRSPASSPRRRRRDQPRGHSPRRSRRALVQARLRDPDRRPLGQPRRAEEGYPLAVGDAAADQKRARLDSDPTNSRTSRDLPIPGVPMTSRARRPSSPTASNACRRGELSLRADERVLDRPREGRHVGPARSTSFQPRAARSSPSPRAARPPRRRRLADHA